MTIQLPVEQEQRLAFVDRRHPAFQRSLSHWVFCEHTFEGGREWFTQNIHGYLKEGTREYADRLQRAYRFNHTREVVQLITKYIFKEGVLRNKEDAPQCIKDFWENATLDGGNIESLMKQISNGSSIGGRIWVVVDSQASGDTITVEDEKNGKARIYAYLVKQQDVLDFSRDDMGELNWILYRVKHRDDEDPIYSTGAVKTRYMLWTKTDWILLEENIKSNGGNGAPTISVIANPASPLSQTFALQAGAAIAAERLELQKNAQVREIDVIRQGVNALGVVPVIPSDNIENSEHYSPAGLVDEIAYLDRAVANYLSNLDAIIQDQTFSQLAMPAQGILPGEDAYEKMLEMGTKRVFLYDGEAGKGPEYLSPDAAQANLIISVIKTIIGEIYHSVGMAGERTKQDNAMGIDNSSGVAKAYDFERMNALLCAKADMLDRTENRIAHLVGMWAGTLSDKEVLDTPDGQPSLIKYPDSYDVRGLPDEFEIAQSLQLLEAPETVRRQQMQAIVEKLFPRIAKKLLDAMMVDLKSWPVDPLETAQAMATIASSARMGATTDSIKQTTQPGSSGGTATPQKSKQGQNPGKSKTLAGKS